MCNNAYRQNSYTLKDDTLVFRHDGETFHLQGEKTHAEVRRVDVGCPTGKDTYPTYAAAEKAYRLKSANGRRQKRIYKCGYCGCWHFTTNQVAIKPRAYSRSRDKEVAMRMINLSLQPDAWILSGGRSRNNKQSPLILTSSTQSRVNGVRMRHNSLQ